MVKEDGVHTLGPGGQHTSFEKHCVTIIHTDGRPRLILVLHEKLVGLQFFAEAPAKLQQLNLRCEC